MNIERKLQVFMKKSKYFFYTFISFAIISIFSISVFAENGDNEDLLLIESQNDLDDIMDIQREALLAVESLYSNFTINSNGVLTYPEEFSGEYLEADTLIICLTDTSDEMIQKYSAWTNNYNKVTFQNATYSLNYLNSIRDSFDELVNDFSLVAYGVDRTANNVFVDLPVIVSVASPVEATASVYGGDGYGLTSGTSSSASICIGGTYNGNNAVASCGHGLSLNKKVYKGSSEIGTVVYQNFGGWGDYSVIKLNSSYTPTNKVRSANGTNSISGCSYYPTAGTAIYKYGTATGYAYGTINQVDVTVTVSDLWGQTTVKGLYGTSIRNSNGTTCIDNGDSGGPAYLKSGSSYNIAGIVCAKVTGQTSTYQTMYFSPIRNVTGIGFTVKTN